MFCVNVAWCHQIFTAEELGFVQDLSRHVFVAYKEAVF